MDQARVTLLGDVARWFADPANWQGPHGIPVRVLEHIELSGLAVAVAVAIAMPVALYLGHVGRGGFIAISVGLGLGFWPTMFALVPLAIPPIVTNTFVAVRQVDRDVVDAARGMGLAERQILARIEVPLGLPLMLDGIRTAAVNVVATATLGALVAGGALGRFIVDGFALREYDQLVGGALLVALLAIVTEITFGALARASAPRGMTVER